MVNIKNDESLPMSRYPTPVVGRLIAMPTTNTSLDSLSAIAGYRTGVVSFDFPAMPDMIDLARNADYYVNFTPVTPDGIHQYRGTKPLEIPMSFKLHAMDPTFCPYGSLTLLQMAARLHSFVLPVSPDGSVAAAMPVTAGSLISPNVQGTEREQRLKALGVKDDATQLYDSAQATPVYEMQGGKSGKKGGYPPVTCFLNLIWVSENQPGISCIGYVREVRVRLMGPWLKGQNGEFNLPSSGEFEFTFVHRPAHNNNYGFAVSQDTGQYQTAAASVEVQAYATDVRDRLFNTRNLVLMANYNGYGSAQVPTNSTVNSSIGAGNIDPRYAWEGPN